MDSVTQVVLGAAVGEVALGKKIGNKALLWGAIGGTIPDLDVIAQFVVGIVESSKFHRSATHSILFCIVMAPVLGALVSRLYPKASANWREWSWLFFLALFTHPLLDCFTTWGTQLFWPFTDYQVAFKTIFVIDPGYTLPMLVALIAILFIRRTSPLRKRVNVVGMVLSHLYLTVTLVNKWMVNEAFKQSYTAQGIQVERFETKPTPINNVLWSGTLETEDHYYIGFYSLLDSEIDIPYKRFAKNHELLSPYVEQDQRLQTLLGLSTGYYTVVKTDFGFIINDLRFGQAKGWNSDDGEFVFAYNYYPPEGDVPSRFEKRPPQMEDGKELLKQIFERAFRG